MSFWEDAANTLTAQNIFYDLKGKSKNEMFNILNAAFEEYRDDKPDVLRYLCEHISSQSHTSEEYNGAGEALLATGIVQFVKDNL